MKRNYYILDAIVVIAWTFLFGALVEKYTNESLMEIVAVICGASLGISIMWGIRFFQKNLK